MYLFQRNSEAIQRGNTLAFTNTFDTDNISQSATVIIISPLFNNFLPAGYVLACAKKNINHHNNHNSNNNSVVAFRDSRFCSHVSVL